MSQQRVRRKEMNSLKKLFLWLTLIFILPFVLHIDPALSISDEEIFLWVSKELKVEKDYPMPKIQFVPKETLQQMYRKHNKKAYKQWSGQYGAAKADELMALYLNELIGLCIPKTCEIFVASFLKPCKRQAITAHELVHYIQVMKEGAIDPKAIGAADKYLYNEMQASMIERAFMKVFCGSSDPN
jgi:hypothetical protein